MSEANGSLGAGAFGSGDSLGVAGRLVEERPPAPSALQAWAAPLSGGAL